MLNNLLRPLWAKPLESYQPPVRQAILAARIAHKLVEDFLAGGITLRAMSLVYTTLLSLVPLLALSFSILKAFGVQDALEPLLLNLLRPLGDGAAEIASTVTGFVDNAKVGVLGVVGLLFLFYAAISLIQKIEAGMNEIWRAQNSRSLGRRFTDYVSVLTIGPVVVVAAITLTASLTSNKVIGEIVEMTGASWAIALWGRLLPVLLIAGLFTFIYKFLPNTKVRPLPAIMGAVIAAILWQLLSWAFAYYGAQAGSYKAIYSGFAVVLLLMVWLYLAWLIVLGGAQIAFYIQYPELMRSGTQLSELSPRSRREMAVEAMTIIVRSWRNDHTSVSARKLANTMQVPSNLLGSVMEPLFRHGMLVTTDTDEERWVPGRDPDHVPMANLLSWLDQHYLAGSSDLNIASPKSTGLMARIDSGLQAATAGMVVGDLDKPLDDLATVTEHPEAALPLSKQGNTHSS